MKYLLYILAWVLSTPIAAFSQIQSCQNIFICPFQADSGNRPELAAQLTADMEEMFLKNYCTVFTSADIPNFTNKTSSIPGTISVTDISTDLVSLLTTMKSDKLMTGRIRLDNGNNAIIQITMLSLPAKEILGTKKLMFSELELQKDELRKGKLTQVLTMFSMPTVPVQPDLNVESSEPYQNNTPDEPFESDTPPIVINAPISLSSPPAQEERIQPRQPDASQDKPKKPNSTQKQPKQEPYYEISIIVGAKVDRISIPGYGNLMLSKKSDGNKQTSIRLKKGNYEMHVYQDGKLKCNKPFTADRSKTIQTPCR